MKTIPFNKWSKDKIAQGKKFCTSRHGTYGDDERVVGISTPMPWGFIRDHLYMVEGADSPEELQGVIEEIMHRHVPDDELFSVHFGDFRNKGA